MNKKISYVLVAIIIILVIFFIIKGENKRKSFLQPLLNDKKEINNVSYIKIAGKILKVDLATTSFVQQQGLSGRKELKNDTGMLFVFPKPSKNYFWMKDMNFPIDMIWIGEDLHIIYIERDVKPESYPKTFGPNINSKYVLEVEAQFSKKNNLKVGEKFEFLP